MFVCPGAKVRREVSSMPGIFQQSVDHAVEECREVAGLGIPAIILFGLPEKKDAAGSEAYSPDGAVQLAIAAIRKAVPGMVIISDVCLCEYTSHGHCGVVEGEEILNDPTLDLLARAAVSHADAGADIVAPSDMMDGREQRYAGRWMPAATRTSRYFPMRRNTVGILRSVPRGRGFRAPFGDRRSYQMDPGTPGKRCGK